MHLAVYESCPQARAVVHAHPPTAIAWSIAKPELTELPGDSLSELILAVGKVPIISYARPGTREMGSALTPYLPEHRALVLARHGALTWGESLMESYMGMERLEHTAEILWRAECMGGLTSLPEQELQALRKMRELLGDKTL